MEGLLEKMKAGMITDEEIVRNMFEKFARGIQVDYNALNDTAEGKTPKKSKEEKDLERLRDEGERLYRSLFPLVDIVATVEEGIAAMGEAGLISENSLSKLATSITEQFKDVPTVLLDTLRAPADAEPEVQMVLDQLSAIRTEMETLKTIEEDMERTAELLPFAETIDEVVKDIALMNAELSKTGRVITEEMYGDLAQRVVGDLGADTVAELEEIQEALKKAAPQFVKFFEPLKEEHEKKRLQEIDNQILGIFNSVGQLGPQYRQYAAQAEVAFRIVRAAQAAASLGLSEIIALIIDAAAAFGIFGDEGEKNLSDMDKFLEDIAQLGEEISDRLTDAIIEFVKTGRAEIGDFIDFVLEEFLRAGLSNLVITPAINWVGDALGFAKGGAFDKGGRIVNDPAFLRTKKGLGLMGEAGPEAILPLKKINGMLGVQAVGGESHVNVFANGVPPENIQVRESEVDGQKLYDIIINTVRQGVGNGDLAPELKRMLQVY
jgi:hypothetical protein